jgi:DNA polymerase-1
MQKLILVDASGLIYRGFYAIPPFFRTKAGVQVNAVFGFTSIILTLLANHKPDYLAVAYDKKGPTFRHKEYTEYKATRVKAPQELYDQIPIVKDVVSALEIPAFDAEGFEADDIIATIVEHTAEPDLEIFIASGDFDVFQMANQHTHIIYPTKGFREAEIFKIPDIEKKYSLKPEQIPDYKGLAGDSSDNIPGVRGIGPVGAKSLLQKYGTLEGIYEHLSEVGGVTQKKLEDNKEMAFLSKRIATLDRNAPVKFHLGDCRAKHFNVTAARKIFTELGFKSLQGRLDELYGVATTGPAQKALF